MAGFSFCTDQNPAGGVSEIRDGQKSFFSEFSEKLLDFKTHSKPSQTYKTYKQGRLKTLGA